MKNKEMTVSILGLGWLGLPLAVALKDSGLTVQGSTTHPEKVGSLKRLGIPASVLKLGPHWENDLWSPFLASEILIINVPPKAEHLHQMTKLMSIIPTPETKILYVSSTSVYGDHQDEVTEDTLPEPTEETGKLLVKAEAYIKSTGRAMTILRPGGLLGPDRHPARILSGKKNIPNPNLPVNLIHQQDVIGIIQKIIERQAWNEVFNGVSDVHQSREVFYRNEAERLRIPMPEFSEVESELPGKRVSNQKVKKILKYEFRFPDLNFLP